MDRQLRPCKHAGCPELTRDKSGYCEAHRIDQDKQRGSASSRGYDKQWSGFRVQYLKRHPLCHDCEAEGMYVTATEVHHIKRLRDYPELKYAEDNLMGLCHECHSKRTVRGE